LAFLRCNIWKLKIETKEGLSFYLTFCFLHLENCFSIHSLVIKKLLLLKDLIDVHANKEITDKHAIELKYQDVIAIEHKPQIEEFSLLGEDMVE